MTMYLTWGMGYGPCFINFWQAVCTSDRLNCAVLSRRSNGRQSSQLIGRISDGVRRPEVTFRWMWLADVRPASLLDSCQLQIASELVARKLLCAEGWCDMSLLVLIYRGGFLSSRWLLTARHYCWTPARTGEITISNSISEWFALGFSPSIFKQSFHLQTKTQSAKNNTSDKYRCCQVVYCHGWNYYFQQLLPCSLRFYPSYEPNYVA